ATNGSLNFPWGLALDQKSNTLYIADASNNRIRTAAPISATFSTSTNSLPISTKSNGAISDPVSFGVTSTAALLYSVTVSGPVKLSLTPTSGVMPSSIQVQADPTAMNAGTYTDTITI